jgi:SAM-dependent methyltransferase
VLDEGLEIVARLEREREDADRVYNQALTDVDRALATSAALPPAPPPFDDTRLADLNRVWDILPGGSLVSRVRCAIARVLSPGLAAQRVFNSAVVDHLNRNATAQREGQLAIGRLLDVTRQHIEQVVLFQGALIRYLQTITLYADTRDRATGSQAHVVNAALSRLTDDWLKRWESLATREARYDARTSALTKAYDDLREMVAIAQQSAMTLKREMERLQAARAPQAASTAGEAQAPPSDLNSFVYVGFEDRFRGSRDDIRARLTDYLPLFAGATDVLDVGCGRGELLDLFREHGIRARGIDTNHEMVEACRARGLEADRVDAVAFLESRPDASLGGLIAIQVVEHLEPAYLMRLIEAASHALRPGGVMVLETINPGCWVAFFESYIRDLTHVRPLHPDTLRYLVQTSGFSQVDVQYRAPVPEVDRLQRVQLPALAAGQEHDAALVDLVDAVNAHADKLNARLFTFMDYAIVARR